MWWRARWHEECAFSDWSIQDASDLDITGSAHDGPISLRELLVHMAEEYARHHGHADLRRECIDGRPGQ